MSHILLAVVILVGVSQLSNTQVYPETCDYPDCVYEGIPKVSGIEFYFTLLNILQIPDDAEAQCQILIRRANECSGRYAGCPTSVTLEYSRRLDDPAYVYYIMNLGTHVCNKLEDYLRLQDCFTDSLQSALQSCIFQDGYDILCVRDSYQQRENCSEGVDEIFLNLFDNWLIKNPYQRRD